ncbi:MAG: TRAP transporter small permease [Paracoccaceae bacterium]
MAGHATAVSSMRHGGNPVLRAIAAVSTVCGVVAATMIVAAVAITCQMIFVRFVLNASTIWQTEAVVYLMIGATMIGLPYVQLLRGHVNVDLLPLALPPKARRGRAAAILALAIAVVGVMAFYGFELWLVAFERGWRTDTVWGPKLWIPYTALPLGFGLYLVQLAADLYAAARGIDTPFGADAGEAKAPLEDAASMQTPAGEAR